MNKIGIYILSIVFVGLFYGCNSPKEKNVNDSIEPIETVKRFMGDSLKSVEEYEIKYDTKYTFDNVEAIEFDLNGDDSLDSIYLKQISDWNDPGDFQKILFKLNDKEIEFSNFEGWVKLSDYELQFLKEIKNENLINSDHALLLRASDNNLVFIVFGYAYASTTGLLTIINIPKHGEPYLVYNENKYLYNFIDINNDGVKDISVSNYSSYKLENNAKLQGTQKTYSFEKGWLIKVD